MYRSDPKACYIVTLDQILTFFHVFLLPVCIIYLLLVISISSTVFICFHLFQLFSYIVLVFLFHHFWFHAGWLPLVQPHSYTKIASIHCIEIDTTAFLVPLVFGSSLSFNYQILTIFFLFVFLPLCTKMFSINEMLPFPLSIICHHMIGLVTVCHYI